MALTYSKKDTLNIIWCLQLLCFSVLSSNEFEEVTL